MNIIFRLIFCLCTIFYNSLAHQAQAQDPVITLTAEKVPLGDILNTITQETGYTFNLNKDWRDYPVSATIDNLPLEKGLKRLLRSLNYTIIWESDRIISIKIFSKVDPKRPKPAISPSYTPPTYQVVPEPNVEPVNEPEDQVESADVEAEQVDTGEGEEGEAQGEAGDDEAQSETGDEEPFSQEDNPDQPRG